MFTHVRGRGESLWARLSLPLARECSHMFAVMTMVSSGGMPLNLPRVVMGRTKHKGTAVGQENRQGRYWWKVDINSANVR